MISIYILLLLPATSPAQSASKGISSHANRPPLAMQNLLLLLSVPSISEFQLNLTSWSFQYLSKLSQTNKTML